MKRAFLNFYGGVGEVTGSRHLLRYGETSLLLDCGLFQGHRLEAIEKNRSFPFSISHLSSVLLSHAHIDHSGGLPLLARHGFSRPIHCTAPTADLCRTMLLDSAFLQEEDAKYFNKIHQADGEIIEPLYTRQDAENAIKLLQPHGYDEPFEIDNGIRARFLNAGHVLGSAMIEIELDLPKGIRRVLFTGDLGRRESILMEPPTIPENIDYLLMETTYGNRAHEPLEQVEKLFIEMIHQATQEKGIILIPSFALERTQEVAFILAKLQRKNKISPIHIYIDSPMAVDITEIFQKNLDCPCLSEAFKIDAKKSGDPFGFASIRYVRTAEESKSLNEKPGQKIIIAGSGMCEGGRILHHLRNNIGKDNTFILLVGYQANGTLGGRLANGAKKVKIFGLQHEVRASVRQLHNLSAHADRNDLMWFVKGLNTRPKIIFLVHGDTDERKIFMESLRIEGIERVQSPLLGDEQELT